MRVTDLVKFMKAREAVRVHHITDYAGDRAANIAYGRLDTIIKTFRFCNMDRNDDRVTRFIFEWSKRYHLNADLWFAFVVARLFNQPDTLDDIAGFVLPFKPQLMRDRLHARAAHGKKVFNAAYIVSTNGISMDKVDYVIDIVLSPIWAARKVLRPKALDTLASWHADLQGHRGMGSFMAAQVVADLKYQPGPLASATDFATFAASGPGSRRGLNRVLDEPTDDPWKETVWRATLTELRELVLPRLKGTHLEDITAQNLQNCLCEFDKYERARLGEGAPKQLYAPWKGKSA